MNEGGKKIQLFNSNKLHKTAIVAFVFFAPLFVSAGVLSLFKTNKISFENNQTIFNSQNMEILEDGSGYQLSVGGGNIEIVDKTALVASKYILSEDVVINKPENGKISVYEVREGDTLSQIADMFDVSVNTIRWANEFSGPIKPGQKLVILPVTGVTHTIKYGGTIEDVAEIYDADVAEIALFNGLGVDAELQPGDKIVVPHVDQVYKTKDSGSTTQISSNSHGYYYQNPLPGGIITQGVHGYNSVDIGASYGTPIYAAATGKVITSKQGGWNGGYGSYVVISHANGTQTLYSHQSENTVYVGQVVEAGQVIGYVGSTGRSTGNHLHFEVRGASNPLSSCSVGSRCYID